MPTTYEFFSICSQTLRGLDQDIYDMASARAGEVIPEAIEIEQLVVTNEGGQQLRHRCRAQAEHPCCFATDGRGGRPQGKHDSCCVFCSPEAMKRTIQTQQGRCPRHLPDGLLVQCVGHALRFGKPCWSLRSNLLLHLPGPTGTLYCPGVRPCQLPRMLPG